MRKIVLISIIILSTLLFLNMVEAQNQIMCLGNFPDSVSSPCTGNLNLSSTDLCTYGFESLLDGFSNVSTIGDESAIQNVSLTMWHSDCDGSDINFLLNEVTIKTIPDYLTCSCTPTPGLDWPTVVKLNTTELASFTSNWNFGGANTVNITKLSILYNSLSYVNITYISDIISPSINFVFPTESNGTTLPRNYIFINVSANDTYLSSITFVLYNSSHVINISSSTTSPFYFNVSNLSDGTYYFNASAIDTAGNLNKTEIRTVLVATNIIFGNVTYNPNTTDLLDPTTNVTFNVNITSITGNISIVKLQFHNSSGWVNYSAYNITNITYQVNVTLPGTNASNSYNFWANTTIGASLETSNATLGSFWDCSWSVNPISFEELSGYFQSKQLGNISINNSGDVSYSTNNCSIIFTITQISSTFSTDYLVATFPSGTPRGMSFATDSVVLAAKANTTVAVTVGYPEVTSALQETPKIKVDASIRNTNTANLSANITNSVVVTPPGPYLFQTITSSTTSVSLTPGNFTIEAYVRNLAGNGSLINSAYNVTFNWSIQPILNALISSGNSSLAFGNLSNSSKQESNLTVLLTSTNLVDLNQSTYEVYIYSSGYNRTGSIINHAGNLTTLVESKNISFTCYSTIDSICVEACGNSLDPDCDEVTVSVDSGSGGGNGGGSGGGGGAGGAGVVTKADYQITRGKTNEKIG